MLVLTKWTDKMRLVAAADSHEVQMDTKPPLGDDSALTPKQLLIAGLAGCTAMDVVALLKKHKQLLRSLEIETEVEKSTGVHPEIFTSARLTFRIVGLIDPVIARDAVIQSQTKYCGVSAMLSKAFPIRYRVEVNGVPVGEEGLAFPSTANNKT